MSSATGPYSDSTRVISVTSAWSRSVTSLAWAAAAWSFFSAASTSSCALVTAAFSFSTSRASVTSTRLRAAIARSAAAAWMSVARRSRAATPAR